MILNVRLYDTLRRELKVSDETAKEIVLSIQEVAEEEHKKCAQKVEFLTKDIQALATHFDLKLGHLEEKVNANIERTKFYLTKWMIAAWVTQLAVIASLFIFLKK